MNPLVDHGLSMELAPLGVLVSQLGFMAVCVVLLYSFWRKHYSRAFGRICFYFSILFVAFYQLPSVLYGGHLYSALQNPFHFLAVINLLPILLALWLHVSAGEPNREVDVRRFEAGGAITSGLAESSLWFTVALSVATIGAFFFYIPWGCTGLWAILHDPEATLLARELSMKLNNHPAANRIYGFYVNVVGPLVCFLGICTSVQSIRDQNVTKTVLSVLVLFLAVALLLIGGIKGALVNAAVFVAVAVMFLQEGKVRKVLAGIACLLFFGASILLVELVRDQGLSGSRSQYDYGRCAKYFGSCEAASRLIQSAQIREDGGLGLSKDALREYQNSLKDACGPLTQLGGGFERHQAVSVESLARKRGDKELESKPESGLTRMENLNAALDIAKNREEKNSTASESDSRLVDASHKKAVGLVHDPSPERMANPSEGLHMAKRGDAENSTALEEKASLVNSRYKNKVVNGDFHIWQCEKYHYGGSSYRFQCAEMWRVFARSGYSGVATYSRQKFEPDQYEVPGKPDYFFRWNQTASAEASVGLTNPIGDVRTLAGKAVTLSFYAKANTDRVVALQLEQNFGVDGSGSVRTGFSDVLLTTNWKYHTRTLVLPSVEGKIVGKGSYLDLQFSEPSASTFVIDIAQVQLEEGLYATPFEKEQSGLQEQIVTAHREWLKGASVHGSVTAAQPISDRSWELVSGIGRSWELVNGIWVRFFRVPLQVAAWHYLYVEEKSPIGWSVVPLIGRLYSGVENISESVYKMYGFRYSDGDSTSTSTAPTSFVLLYSAHLGWKGLVLAVLLLIVFDGFCASVSRGLPAPLNYAMYGFLAATAVSMITSDIFAVLISHGGFLGFCLFYLLKKTAGLNRPGF